MAKKQPKPEEPAGESAPMWIVSFADLVTLMMSFFVVLYAMKQGGPEQQLETAVAIKSTFGWEPDMTSDSDLNLAGRRYQGIDSPPYSEKAGKASKATQGADGSNS